MRVQHSAAIHERAQVAHVLPFDFAGAENAFADERDLVHAENVRGRWFEQQQGCHDHDQHHHHEDDNDFIDDDDDDDDDDV